MLDIKMMIAKASEGVSFTAFEASELFERMADGQLTPAQMSAILIAMRMRGETETELVAAARALRSRMRSVIAPPDAIDIVGTGGDGSGSLNVSTCAAFIVAGVGVPVAKHGNRAQSSRCGAADVLSALGVEVELDPDAVEDCVTEAGIGFMFAPRHHPALRHVAAVRVELGTRTLFNLLGPLLNPAGVRRHLVGVFSPRWVMPMAEALAGLGAQRAFVVHSADGLDEISTVGPTSVAALARGTIETFTLEPEAVGLTRVAAGALAGGDALHNAEALRAVLRGERGAYRDVAVFNAAAALVVAERAQSLKHGVQLAQRALDSGAALQCLERLKVVSQRHSTAARSDSK